jgi:hypothetical protein
MYKTMRTKALLVAAAITAVGLATSLAQTNVYSQNVVGYINLNLTNTWQIICNQLDLDGTGTNNTVMTVFGTNLPSGSAVYAFTGGAFASPPASYSTKTGWSGNTNAVNAALNPGGGVFVAVPSAKTVTLVGNVMQGSLNTPYISGYNMVASQVPQAGLLQTDLGYAPVSGAAIYRFNAASQAYISPPYSYSTKTGWSPSQPSVNVGEGFWLASPGAGTWTRDFTVQ